MFFHLRPYYFIYLNLVFYFFNIGVIILKHSIEHSFGKVVLKPLTEEESENMRIARNKNSIWFGCSGQIDKEQQKQWYKNYINKETEYMFSIFHKQTGAWIGAVGIYDLNSSNFGYVGEFGRLIIDADLKPEKGLGIDATICMCQIGFELLKMEKISLIVFSDNISAKTIYLNTGFKVIDVQKNTETRNNIFMELKKEDFKFINAHDFTEKN